MAKSKSKLKANARRAARPVVADQRFRGRIEATLHGVAARGLARGVASVLAMSSPRRTARIGARVRPTVKGRLTSLAQATGKSEGEILELAIGRLMPSHIVGPTWVSRVLFWRR